MDDHQCYLLNQLADINPKRTISLLFVELFMDEAIRAGNRRGVVLVCSYTDEDENGLCRNFSSPR